LHSTQHLRLAQAGGGDGGGDAFVAGAVFVAVWFVPEGWFAGGFAFGLDKYFLAVAVEAVF
jgi:hypothetical protein